MKEIALEPHVDAITMPENLRVGLMISEHRKKCSAIACGFDYYGFAFGQSPFQVPLPIQKALAENTDKGHYLERLNTSFTLFQVLDRLNTSFTIVVIQRRKSIAHIDDALWQNQTKHIQTRNWSVSMRSIDISEANALPKSAKVLPDQECGCGNGSEDTTIPRRVVIRGGSRKNPEHRRMFTGKRIRR